MKMKDLLFIFNNHNKFGFLNYYLYIANILLIFNTNDMNECNKEGQRHGPWESYYENGKLSYKGNYLNGKVHGLFESYYSDGNLRFKSNYINGKRHGLWKAYYLNGKLSFKGNYLNGKRHGPCEYYHSNAKLHEIEYNIT